jgi:hypothetical protein
MATEQRLPRAREYGSAYKYGREGEKQVFKLLLSQGFAVLPAYDIDGERKYEGPRFMLGDKLLVAPDGIVFRRDFSAWVEIKTKAYFSWYKGQWTNGINATDYDDYKAIGEATGLEVWLLFLHESDRPRPGDLAFCPVNAKSPVGLFGGVLSKLAPKIYTRSNGMVYWYARHLELVATLEELRNLTGATTHA